MIKTMRDSFSVTHFTRQVPCCRGKGHMQHRARTETKRQGEYGAGTFTDVDAANGGVRRSTFSMGCAGPHPACVTPQIIFFSTQRPTPVWSRNRWWQKHLQAPTIASQIPLYEHLKHIKNSLETHIAINVQIELTVPNGISEYLQLLFKLMYNY